MLRTKQRSRRQISDLKMDLEIINPIESKTLLGGEWYNGQLDTVYVWGSGYQYTYGGDYQLSSGMYDYGGDWNNYGGDYGGGGGGYGDGQTTEFPDHICKQESYGATCATIALSYVANYFGATGLTASDFAEMSGQNYDAMHYGIGGLTGANISTIMNNVFQSTIIDGSTASIESNLNVGNPILATIDYGSGVRHEVVITGFDAYAGTVSFMDSISGGLETKNINSVAFTNQLYAVTGVQTNSIVNQYKNDKNDVTYCTICGH